jgi:hypothetical protein
MGLFFFIFIVFVVIVGGCYSAAKSIGNGIFGSDSSSKNTYVDKSVHHHYHDNRSVNVDGETFKSLKK